MWTLKHEIRLPKFYELLIKIELKGETAMDIKKFYNHIKICINMVTRLLKDLLPDYQSIKRLSEFEEYFLPDRGQPSYYWNANTYTSLGHSLLVTLTNYICVKSSMAPQAYKVLNTHAHEISEWKILSRILDVRTPHLGGMHGGVQYDPSTLEFKNREQLEDFHSIILRLQQEIFLSGETVYSTRLLFQKIKAPSKSDKLKAFILPKMTHLIKFLDNNEKSTVYTGANIHGLYHYLGMI